MKRASATPSRVPELTVFQASWQGWGALALSLGLAAGLTYVPWAAWSEPLVSFQQGLVRGLGPLFGLGAWLLVWAALCELLNPTPSLVVRNTGLEIGGSGVIPWNAVRGAALTAAENGVHFLEFDVCAPWLDPRAGLSLHAAGLNPGLGTVLHNLKQRGVPVLNLARTPTGEAAAWPQPKGRSAQAVR